VLIHVEGQVVLLVGWESLPPVDPDGQNWPLPFAAKILDVSERRLRKEVRDRGVEPSGVLKITDFRRSGRHPRAYPAAELIIIAESFQRPPLNPGEQEISRNA